MESKPMSSEQIAKLLQFMLQPRKGERLLFLTDYSGRPSTARLARAELLSRWYNAAALLSQKLDFRLLPIAKCPDAPSPNADLPSTATTHDGGRIDNLHELIASCDIVVAMTEHSASAQIGRAHV